MKTNLDALDKLIAEMPYEGPPREGEYTVYDYQTRYEQHNGVPLSLPAAQRHLKKMEDEGLVTMRKGRVNGKQGNIYKPA
jgi:DNA-binding transcriptional ArsR family regulator